MTSNDRRKKELADRLAGLCGELQRISSLLAIRLQQEIQPKADQQATQIPPITRVLTQTCDSELAANKDQQKSNYRLQCWANGIQLATALFTALAFLAAAIYACIANRQLDEMRSEQRPWIGAPGVELAESANAYRLVFENFGHLPTKGLYINGDAETGDPIDKKIEAEFCKPALLHARDNSRFRSYSIIPQQKYYIEEIADASGMHTKTVRGLILGQRTDFYLAGCAVYGWPDFKALKSTAFWLEFRVDQRGPKLIGSHAIDPN